MPQHVKFALLIVLVFSLAACGGQSADSSSTGKSSIEITGDVNFTFDDSAQKNFIETKYGEDASVWQFMFTESEHMVSIMFYGDKPAAGDYEITPTGPMDGGIGVMVTKRSGDESQLFTIGTYGTITIEQDGDLYGGTFEFSIPSTTDSTATAIHATGTFSEIALAPEAIDASGS